MSEIIDIIKKNRPNLTMSSYRSYGSNVKNLAKKIDIEIKSSEDVKTHVDKIMAFLKDMPGRKRKTYLASLIVLFDKDNDTTEKLRSLMLKDIKEYDNEEKSMEMSDKEKENWIEWGEVMKRYHSLEKEVKPLYKLEVLNKHQFQRVMVYTLLSCLVLIPPRRSQDYTEFKLRGIDKKEDNYMDSKKNQFCFNKYKTKRTYGQACVDIPPKLKKIMNDWAKINDSEYAFLDSRGNKLNQTKLTTILYNFFNRKVSTSMLRHIYITHHLKDVPKDILEVAQDMGHSVEQNLKYRKNTKSK